MAHPRRWVVLLGPPGTQRTSTIGREKATNPLLRAGDEDAFVSTLLGLLGSFPPYFLRLAEVNRRGPAVLEADPNLPALDVAVVRALLAEGAQLVDVRPCRSSPPPTGTAPRFTLADQGSPGPWHERRRCSWR